MVSINLLKKCAILMPSGCLLVASPAAGVEMKLCVAGDARITQVYLNSADWNGRTLPDGYVGIEVLYPNLEDPNPANWNKKYKYTSYGFSNIYYPHGSILLQLANSAMMSQAKVEVYVDGDASCTTVGGYFEEWGGLRVSDSLD